MIKFVALAAMVLASTAVAQVKVDRFYPPAVGPGESAITAEGKLPSWPCKIFCDRDDVKVAPDEKSGNLKVVIAENTPPGVAWIRLYDDKTASNLIPLLVETVAVTEEPKDAQQPIALPAVIAGRLAKSGEVDSVLVSLKAGEQLLASLIGNQILQSPMDAVLQVADLKGNVLIQADDVRGLDPQAVYQAVTDLDVVVRIFAFPSTANSTVGFAGSSSYTYALRLTTGTLVDHVSPIAVGVDVNKVTAAGWNLPDQPELKRRDATTISPPIWYSPSALGWHWQPSLSANAANVIESTDPAAFATADTLPAVFCGRIDEAKQVDRLRFKVTKGKKYNAQLYAKSSGFLLDGVIRVIDVKSGNEIIRKDDVSRTDFDTVVDFTAKEDAEYELQVTDAVEAFGIRHVYAVRLQEALPEVSLTVAADQVFVQAGATVEIPIAIGRTNGFAGKLSVTATGLPDNVTATPVVSEAKGDTAKSVKLKVTAKEGVIFNSNIQIVATLMDGEKPTGETRTATFAMRPEIELSDIWLTVATK